MACLIKLAMFPGAIGIDVAKDIGRRSQQLPDAGARSWIYAATREAASAALRPTSYLTPGKLEVGYSLTRKRREPGYRREELTRFEGIPWHKATLLWLAARYALVEKSILVVTEGMGASAISSTRCAAGERT